MAEFGYLGIKCEDDNDGFYSNIPISHIVDASYQVSFRFPIESTNVFMPFTKNFKKMFDRQILSDFKSDWCEYPTVNRLSFYPLGYDSEESDSYTPAAHLKPDLETCLIQYGKRPFLDYKKKQGVQNEISIKEKYTQYYQDQNTTEINRCISTPAEIHRDVEAKLTPLCKEMSEEEKRHQRNMCHLFASMANMQYTKPITSFPECFSFKNWHDRQYTGKKTYEYQFVWMNRGGVIEPEDKQPVREFLPVCKVLGDPTFKSKRCCTATNCNAEIYQLLCKFMNNDKGFRDIFVGYKTYKLYLMETLYVNNKVAFQRFDSYFKLFSKSDQKRRFFFPYDNYRAPMEKDQFCQLLVYANLLNRPHFVINTEYPHHIGPLWLYECEKDRSLIVDVNKSYLIPFQNKTKSWDALAKRNESSQKEVFPILKSTQTVTDKFSKLAHYWWVNFVADKFSKKVVFPADQQLPDKDLEFWYRRAQNIQTSTETIVMENDEEEECSSDNDVLAVFADDVSDCEDEENCIVYDGKQDDPTTFSYALNALAESISSPEEKKGNKRPSDPLNYKSLIPTFTPGCFDKTTKENTSATMTSVSNKKQSRLPVAQPSHYFRREVKT